MKKISLKSVSKVLSDRELKNVLGGSGSDVYCYQCATGDKGTCISDSCFDVCPGGWTQWTPDGSGNCDDIYY